MRLKYPGHPQLILPLECVDQVVHVYLQEPVYDSQGIFIWRSIKIQSTPQKVFYRITHKKLFGGSRVATYIEENTRNAQRRTNHRILNGRGFIGMFIGHFVSVFPQFIKIVSRNAFVADVNARMKLGKIDIDPKRVFRLVVKKRGIARNFCILGIFKGIGKIRFVE
jgi:hypothetical protein